MKLAALCAAAAALALAACSSGPLREDVIAQARPGGRVAFDVVKIDDRVLATMEAQKRPAFGQRFKPYLPPPDIKVAVGDTVAVVIWESAANGLFGNSLTDLSLEAGAAARLLTGETAAAPPGVPSLPEGLTASPQTLAALFGGAAAAAPNAPASADVAPSGGLAAGRDVAAVAAAEAEAEAAAEAAPGPAPGGGRTEAAEPSAEIARTPNPQATLGRPPRPGLAPGDLAQRREALVNLAVQTGRPGTRIPDQQVGSDGAISIPYAGRVAVAGRTPLEVQHAIETRLATKALDPQVLVFVKRSVANSVSVTGGIVRGTRVALSPGGDRLLQVIAAAGGAKAPVHDTVVRLSRGGVTATVPLAALVGDPAEDIFAAPGDVVTLSRRPQTFSVFGATGKNAAIAFDGAHLSLAEALAKAGGLLDERADSRAVFLFRYEPVALVRALGEPIATGASGGLSPVVYRLDLHDARSALLARHFPMQDKDVIFVANARTQPIYEFFQALSQVSGPVETGFITCHVSGC